MTDIPTPENTVPLVTQTAPPVTQPNQTLETGHKLIQELSDPVKKNKKESKAVLPALIMVLLLVMGGGALGYRQYLLRSDKKISDTKLSATPLPTTISKVSVADQSSPSALIKETKEQPEVAPVQVEIKSVNWYPEPKKVAQQGFLNEEGKKDDVIDYYEMGITSKGETVYYFYKSYGHGSSKIVAIKSKSYLYVGGSEDYVIDNVKSLLADNAQLAKIEIAGLEAPDELVVGGNTYEKGSLYKLGLLDRSTETKIGDTKYGPLSQTRQQDTGFAPIYHRDIYLTLADHTQMRYSLNTGLYGDDHKMKITWSHSTDPNEYFEEYPRSGGCGGPAGDLIINDNTDALYGMTKVGTFAGGDVFRIESAENILLKKFYEEDYKTAYQNSKNFLSYAQFVAKPSHFLIKDRLGDYQMFVSSNYALLAECGKPVIYLYPTETTDVSVKVAADVRVSDPQYPTSGWLATAHPDGRLVVNGKQYDSLFWEGKGNGTYPDHRNDGVIVKQAELTSAITQQLKQLGLNDRERLEFEQFWFDKLPTSPYVRLTWLLTEDMNILAPLTVKPKPDTVIRIFLETEGMVEPRTLIPQKLTAPDREGFTLVEWGGLLIRKP